jgi:ABC-type bacteriocin/lantibiotic exporter with double-glycine peptidase domain
LFSYFRSLHSSVNNTVLFMDSVMEHWIAVERMAPLLLDQNDTSRGTKLFPQEWQELRLEKVSARYKDDRGGVEDLSLTIRRGEHIGIVGCSGSGKSSLAKVLMGVLPTQQGSYTIDGIPFAEITTHARSQNMSMVLQDSELFNMSLAENVAAMRSVSTERMSHAVRIAALDSVIAKLKNGLKELIGEKGYKLSGGERQRVGIARAICKDPEILVLDEATSALDSQTEAGIHEALQEELGSKTMIIIAHRLSTLRSVDRIIVLENGKIAEEGPPEALLANPESKFSQMSRAQHALKDMPDAA